MSANVGTKRAGGIGGLLDRPGFVAGMFLSPAVLYMLLLLGVPFVGAIAFSLTDITIGVLFHTMPSFVGLENFASLLDDPDFRQALRNTFVFAIGSQMVAVILGNILAQVLMAEFRFKPLFRVLVLLPWATPIALGVLGWKWMYDSIYSIINYNLRFLGLLTDGNWPIWLGNPDLAPIAIILVHAWKSFPFVGVIIVAANTSIPRNVIDAAKVDGAGFFRQLFKINLPIVLPIVTVGLVFGTVFAFTDMSVIWLLTRGGPMNVTHVLATLAFQNGILSGDIGRGSAISVFLVPILGILVVMALRGIRREA